MSSPANRAPRIVVVDDDERMREMLTLGLVREGFEIRALRDGTGLLDLVRAWTPDLVLLDIVLPKLDGFALLPMVRRTTEAPILMLSARGEAEDKIDALNGGADDYVAKPFVFEELLARIGAALRRPALAARDVLTHRDLTVDLGERTVTRGARPVSLSPREFDLLVHFLRAPRRVFAKDELLDAVWGHDFEGGIGVVERYVSYLRAKLHGTGESRIVRTVHGVGFGLADAP